MQAGIEAEGADEEADMEGEDVDQSEIDEIMKLAKERNKNRGGSGAGGGRRGGDGEGDDDGPAYDNPHGIRTLEIQETLQLKRTVAVKKGGKKQSFSAIVCCGNGQGVVALGKGKHAEAIRAIEKATRNCHKFHNIEVFKLYDNRTLFHDEITKWKKTKIIAFAARSGLGLMAPEVVRKICGCIGIQDIQVRILRLAQALRSF